MSTPEPLFPIANAQRRAKGVRWMRAVQRQIADAWVACTETDTHLTHATGLQAEAETVAISVAFAVTALRVVDREVFNEEYVRTGKTARSSRYERFRDADDQGRVVLGLAMIRNAEIHAPVVIDPNIERAVSIPGTTPSRFRVCPTWVPYRALPSDVRRMTKGKRATDARRQAQAYRSHIAGRLVMETLLDALAFLVRCDPNLARREATGDLGYFPLPEIAQHGYERRHPEWPTKEECDIELRARSSEQAPAGSEREILHRLLDAQCRPEAYVGFTLVQPGYWEAFVERPQQIASDVLAGFPYRVGSIVLTVAPDGTTMAGNDPLDDVALRPAPVDSKDADGTRTEGVWRGMLDLADEDADLYARQRRIS